MSPSGDISAGGKLTLLLDTARGFAVSIYAGEPFLALANARFAGEGRIAT
jgi:hypothetical protein